MGLPSYKIKERIIVPAAIILFIYQEDECVRYGKIIIVLFVAMLLSGCKKESADSKNDWVIQIQHQDEEITTHIDADFTKSIPIRSLQFTLGDNPVLKQPEDLSDFLIPDKSKVITEEENSYSAQLNGKFISISPYVSYFIRDEVLSSRYTMAYSSGNSSMLFKTQFLMDMDNKELENIDKEAAREQSDELLKMFGWTNHEEAECYAMDYRNMNKIRSNQEVYLDENMEVDKELNKEWTPDENAYLFLYQGYLEGEQIYNSTERGVTPYACIIIDKEGPVYCEVGSQLNMKDWKESDKVVTANEAYEICINRLESLMIYHVQIDDLTLQYIITDFSYESNSGKVEPIWTFHYTYEQKNPDNSMKNMEHILRINAIDGRIL